MSQVLSESVPYTIAISKGSALLNEMKARLRVWTPGEPLKNWWNLLCRGIPSFHYSCKPLLGIDVGSIHTCPGREAGERLPSRRRTPTQLAWPSCQRLGFSEQSVPMRRMRTGYWWGVAVEAHPVGGLGEFLVSETPGWSILIFRSNPRFALFGCQEEVTYGSTGGRNLVRSHRA